MSPSFQAQGSSKRLDPDGTVSEDEGRGWGEGRLGLCLCEVRLRVGVRGGTARRERPAERGRSGWTGLGSETCIFQAWCPRFSAGRGSPSLRKGQGRLPAVGRSSGAESLSSRRWRCKPSRAQPLPGVHFAWSMGRGFPWCYFRRPLAAGGRQQVERLSSTVIGEYTFPGTGWGALEWAPKPP